MELRTIIETRLKELGKNQNDLCEALDIASGTVSTWKKRNSIGKKHLAAVAKFLQVDPKVLLGFKPNGTNKIPLVKMASCGLGGVYYDDASEYVEVPNEFARDGNYAIIADGDSMTPKIKDGDYIICSTSDTVQNGDIVHYNFDGTSGVKKLFMSGDNITLIPLNNEYDPIIASGEITLHKCIATFSKL